MELKKYQAYYIEPVKMQRYISQMIYVRNGNDEEFRINLMMKGKTEF
jgi:hypothetical protein